MKNQKQYYPSYRDMPLGLRLWRLFCSTLSVCLVAFGGGFVVLPLLKKKYVEQYGWLNDAEMTDVVAIGQSAPGTIAGNAIMVIGFKVAGVLGALVTMVASILPPLIILTAVFYIYTAIIGNIYVVYFMYGMQAGVAAVIIDFIIKMIKDGLKDKHMAFWIATMLGSYLVAVFTDFSVIYIILIAMGLGVAFMYSVEFYHKKKNTGKSVLSDNKKSDFPDASNEKFLKFSGVGSVFKGTKRRADK